MAQCCIGSVCIGDLELETGFHYLLRCNLYSTQSILYSTLLYSLYIDTHPRSARSYVYSNLLDILYIDQNPQSHL